MFRNGVGLEIVISGNIRPRECDHTESQKYEWIFRPINSLAQIRTVSLRHIFRVLCFRFVDEKIRAGNELQSRVGTALLGRLGPTGQARSLVSQVSPKSGILYLLKLMSQ